MIINRLLFSIILIVFSFIDNFIYSQIISTNRSDTIFCCGHEKLIDVELDGQFEVNIGSKILTDIGYFYVKSLDHIRISSITNSNDPFIEFDTISTIAIGSVGCLWISTFKPGDPDKFIGIRKFIGTDTLWSYLKIEFSDNDINDPNSCNVKIIVKEIVYNTEPNKFLFAGETALTTINQTSKNRHIDIYPNPTASKIYIDTPKIVLKYCFYDQQGKMIPSLNTSNEMIDISNFDNGIYFLKIWTQVGIFWKKIIKIE